MKTTRRQLLGSALTGGTGLLAAGVTPVLQAAETCAGMTRADYERYVSLFNSNDWRFLEYYHPEVVFELGGQRFEGPEGIRSLYTPVKEHIRETVSITRFVSDADGVAVIIPTTFECIKDWQDSFWNRPLKKGEVLRIVSWGFYEVQDGKFRSILTTRSQIVNDWQMEA